jgi:hypothetical protein
MYGSRSDWEDTPDMKMVSAPLNVEIHFVVELYCIVWPLIAQNLEFKPNTEGGAGDDAVKEL